MRTPSTRFLARALACLVLPFLALPASAEHEGVPCANNNPGSPSNCPETCPVENQGSPGEGSNPFYPNGGNVGRRIRDLEVWGGVGEHRLHWTRQGHSRANSGSAWFGEGHNWRHSYQWEMTYGGWQYRDIYYPNGAVYRFTKSNGVWKSEAACPDRLTQDDGDYTLQTADGFRYRFVTLSGPAFQLQDFTDDQGSVYALTYDASGRLAAVSEPGGRSLAIAYVDIDANQSRFETLATIWSVPPADQWTEIAVTDPTEYRYLRYLSPSQGYCNVAEVEFYDENGVKLTGTPFGSSPASAAGQEFDKAFDGDTATFYSFSSRSYGFTGIDLGEGNAKRIGKVRFHPRSGYASRMYNQYGPAKFQGANEAPQEITVVSSVTCSDGRGVTYSYGLFDDPVLETDWVVLAGAVYGDGTEAAYSYSQNWAGTAPLLAQADDPRYPGPATRIEYEFWSDDHIRGNLKEERNPLTGAVLGRLAGTGSVSSKVTYSNGSERTFYFPSSPSLSRVTRKTDGLGRTTTTTYGANGAGFVASVTTPSGTTAYTRSVHGNPLGVTHPDGSAESWTRNALDSVLTHTDELGRTTTWTRDALNRVVRIDHPDSTYETFAYNGFGQVLGHRMRNGGTESNTYDAEGLRTSHTDALGSVTAYTYTVHGAGGDPAPSGLPATVTDPRGNTTTYGYDEAGRPVLVLHPDGAATSYAYDAYGNRTGVTNELGETWEYGYDEFGRMTSATDPLDRTTLYGYDIDPGCSSCHSDDRITRVTLPSGKVVRIDYDAEWQKTAETVGFGTADAATTGYAYDASGNLAGVTDPLGRTTTLTYDSRHRLLSRSDPLGHTTSWTYDAAGNRLTVTRPDNGVTTSTYDAMDRVATTTDPKSQTTTYAYHDDDSLASLTDARSNTYGFEVDLLGRRVKMIYPDASFEQWTYHDTAPAGQIATVYRGRNAATMSCTLDVRNRDVFCDWSDSTPDVTKGYDAAGRLTHLQSSISDLQYTYDAANQLLSETQQPTGQVARTVGYAYDADGNRASVTYPGGTVVEYAYTARNQVSEVVADGPPPLASYTYDLAGNRATKTLENGTVAGYTYDMANRLTQLAHTNGAGVFAQFDYTLDTVGNRTAKQQGGTGVPAVIETYQYDPTDQLTDVAYGATRTTAFAYDATGNRTTVTDSAAGIVPASYTANSLNQYTAVDATAPAYDANGNLTGYAGRSYAYDSENRLLSTTDGTVSVSTTYDARRRAVSRTVGGVTTYFVWDGWSLVEERDAVGALVAKYVHGSQIDEILIRSDVSATNYYHYDGLGSTVALTDGTGAVVESYTYDAFGRASVFDSSLSLLPSSLFSNRFLFTGREWVQEGGLYDYRNRAYSADLGRFLQTDPIRFDAGDVNLYRYVSNDPVSQFDPMGLVAYSSLGDAVDAGQRQARQRTLSDPQNREFCGLVCCSNGTYRITGPIPGRPRQIQWQGGRRIVTPASCTPDRARCTSGTRVAAFHSHPRGSGPGLSDADRDYAKTQGIPTFMIDPSGQQYVRPVTVNP